MVLKSTLFCLILLTSVNLSFGCGGNEVFTVHEIRETQGKRVKGSPNYGFNLAISVKDGGAKARCYFIENDDGIVLGLLEYNRVGKNLNLSDASKIESHFRSKAIDQLSLTAKSLSGVKAALQVFVSRYNAEDITIEGKQPHQYPKELLARLSKLAENEAVPVDLWVDLYSFYSASKKHKNKTLDYAYAEINQEPCALPSVLPPTRPRMDYLMTPGIVLDFGSMMDYAYLGSQRPRMRGGCNQSVAEIPEIPEIRPVEGNDKPKQKSLKVKK